MQNDPGIYAIVNTVNGRAYIGSSLDIKLRLSMHFYHLKNNKHTNKQLQQDYTNLDRYVFETYTLFTIRALSLNGTQSYITLDRIRINTQLSFWEQYYIDIIPNVYNTTWVYPRKLDVWVNPIPYLITL